MSELREGPVYETRAHCMGCRYLQTESWKDYLDNDETDNGTSAMCTLMSKHLGAYWNAMDLTPVDCPLLEPTKLGYK